MRKWTVKDYEDSRDYAADELRRMQNARKRSARRGEDVSAQDRAIVAKQQHVQSLQNRVDRVKVGVGALARKKTMNQMLMDTVLMPVEPEMSDDVLCVCRHCRTEFWTSEAMIGGEIDEQDRLVTLCADCYADLNGD